MLGRKCKAYYLADTRASWGTLDVATGRYEGVAPELTEIESVKDITLPGERMAATQSDRGSDYETGDTGAMQGNVTLTLNHRATDAARDALQAAFFNDARIPVAILNGDKDLATTTGVWCDWKVVKFQESQPETDHVTYDVELIPDSTSAIGPEWVQCEAPA